MQRPEQHVIVEPPGLFAGERAKRTRPLTAAAELGIAKSLERPPQRHLLQTPHAAVLDALRGTHAFEPGSQLGLERKRAHRQLGGRVGVYERAADRAAAARRRVADVAEGVAEERIGISVVLEVPLAGHRADDQGAVLQVDPVEPQLGKIDERRRPREPEVQHRDEALAAGQDLGLVAMFGKKSECLAEFVRVVVLERRRLHKRALSAKASSITRAGESGIRVTSMPIASATALAIAAPAAAVPPSPAPFAPSGLRGVGQSSVISTSTWGISLAVGIR